MANDDLNKYFEAEYEQREAGEEDIVLRYDENGFGTTVDKSFFEYISSFASNVATTASEEVLSPAVTGLTKIVENAASLGIAGAEMLGLAEEGTVDEFAKVFDEYVYANIDKTLGEPDSMFGRLLEGVVQYGTPGFGYYKLFSNVMKLPGMANWARKAVIAGQAEVATVLTAQDPVDGNFATAISELFGIERDKADNVAREFFNYIASPEEETTARSVFESRLKGIIADAPLAIGIEGTIMLLGATGKLFRKDKTKTQIDEVAQTKIRETQANNLFNAITRLKKDEGFSITLDGKDVTELYKEGFMVAPLKTTEIILDSKTFSLADAQKLLDNVEALEKATKGRYKEVYAGAWFNPKDGKFYLDASVRIDNKADALYIANQGEQLSIFNIKDFKTIETDVGIQELKQSGTYSPTKNFIQGVETKGLGRRFEKARLATQGGTE